MSKHLQCLIDVANAALDDLNSGLDDGTYEEDAIAGWTSDQIEQAIKLIEAPLTDREALVADGLRFAENPLGYDSCNDAAHYPYDFANGYADEMLGLPEPNSEMTMAQGGAYRLGRYEAKERNS